MDSEALRQAAEQAVELLEHVTPEGTDFDLSVESVLSQLRAALAK